jgi:hypothetical protein
MTVIQVLMALVQMGVCVHSRVTDLSTGREIPAIVCPLPVAPAAPAPEERAS